MYFVLPANNLGTYLKNKYSSFFSLNLKEGLQMLPGVPPWRAPHRLYYSVIGGRC